MANGNNKVVRYRRKPKAAAFIFIIVFIYIVCFVFMYLSKAKVRTYEVQSGSLTNNASFVGIAVRNEKVYNSEYSGNINFYQREGTKVKTGDTLYTVDETGRVAQILSQYAKNGENSLSKENLAAIKSSLNNFKTQYDGSNFSEIYDLKTDINSTILESINESIMENIDSIIESTGSQNLFRTITADTGGVIVYNIDGYENLTPDAEDFDMSLFDKSNYSRNSLKGEELVVAGNPVYKLVTDENWNIIIPLTQDDIDDYDLASKSSVKIKLKKDNITTNAGFKIIEKDGSFYGKIILNKYMIRYASERYLDIEIVSSGKSGLKVPASAVTEKEFYTIPKEYLTKGGNSNSYGFIVEKYDENNQLTTSFTAVAVYKTTDDFCYIDKNSLADGNSVIKSDSNDRYVVGTVGKIKGIYCVNTGYTVFKQIEIIDQNNEYCIIKKGVPYGISVYDHIILDADKYSENQMIY